MKHTTPGRRAALAASCLGSFLLTGSAIAQQYTVVELPYSDSSKASTGSALSGVGDVTGQGFFPNAKPGYENYDAYLYKAGALKDLGAYVDPSNPNFPATISYGVGINSCGLVAGFSSRNERTYAVIFANGALHNLGSLGGDSAVADGINNQNHVTGSSAIAGNQHSHAFFFSREGGMQDIGTLGGASSGGYAINASDQITGEAAISGPFVTSHAFLYSNGSMQDLGALYGLNSRGLGINARGQVVGITEFIDEYGNYLERAFFYSNGVMRDLSASSGNSVSVAATGINDFGTIVGTSYNINTNVSYAFVYENGTMTDLNTLIGSASSKYGLEEAVAINDRGQILVNGGDTSHQAVFLLTPIKPETRVLLDAASSCE